MADRPRDFDRTQPATPASSGIRETDDYFRNRTEGGSQGQQGQQVADQAREKAGEAMDTARSGMQQAEERVDEKRGTAADSVDQAAQKLRERADSMPGGERTSEMATKAADRLESTATYVRDHDVSQMTSDLEGFVRQHPTESLIAAAAAGFLMGKMLRS
jgi:ElaB/YqjD/DUF883 family membrane-anchored ribosome-binding protein